MLSQIDLCSGVGAGFPLAGIITGGIQLCGLCEIDSFCCDRLRDRFPGVTIYPNVRELWLKPGAADLISSSPPCQPFTVEGKRLGSADERDCIPQILRHVRTSQPKFFVLENVPGLLSAPIIPRDEPGTYFRQILRELHGSGYDAEWIVVGTAQYGTLWSGERLLLVATSRSLKLEWERATPWYNQIRGESKESRDIAQKRSLQSRLARTTVRTAASVDIAPGVPSGNGTTRGRRAALGNCLDNRLAQIALKSVLYLNSIISKSN
ncbi:DNA cytosine methyltransferase [Aetokthonos hydrillicola]|uniref:DNA cytosine methyltransferase n=1 Tax=Aetokthonos hydrillicola TaxID=1550245 RepID=UPI001ABAAC6C|nr:DNA cytosine methyltransferase [Aetokthonos hydrillicola CCALA 1050]MBW4589779.1 DNA cytosine methyltransferase [Aetokthonos hydrillicola CCALA 1050]